MTTLADNDGRTCGNCGIPANCCGRSAEARRSSACVPLWCKSWTPKPANGERAEGREKKLQEGELRLCPFCQCDPVHLEVEQYTDKEWYIKCNVCGTCGPNCETKEIAVGYWNNRAKPTAQDIVDVLEDDGLVETIARQQNTYTAIASIIINAYRDAVRERIKNKE